MDNTRNTGPNTTLDNEPNITHSSRTNKTFLCERIPVSLCMCLPMMFRSACSSFGDKLDSSLMSKFDTRGKSGKSHNQTPNKRQSAHKRIKHARQEPIKHRTSFGIHQDLPCKTNRKRLNFTQATLQPRKTQHRTTSSPASRAPTTFCHSSTIAKSA